MNRFIAATHLNYKDELTWHHEYKGRVVRCVWRNRVGGPPDTNNAMTFLMFDLDDFHNVKKVIQAFTIYINDNSSHNTAKKNADKTTVPY